MDQEALVSILKVVITARVRLGTNLQLTGDPALVRVNLVMWSVTSPCKSGDVRKTLDSYLAFITLFLYLTLILEHNNYDLSF